MYKCIEVTFPVKCLEMTPVENLRSINKTELTVPDTCVLLTSRAAECNTHAS